MLRIFTSIAVLLAIASPLRSAAGGTFVEIADANAVDPAIVALAKEWFYRFQAGNIDRSRLDAASNAELTDEAVRRESVRLKKYGTPTSFEYLGSNAIMASVVGYNFRLTFDKGFIIESIAFNPNGLIVGIDFRTYEYTQ